MFFNYNLFISLVLGTLLFYSGYTLSGIIKSMTLRFVLILLLFALSLPGMSFIAYYLHLIEEPIWYVEFRSVNNVEILVSAFGLLLGFIAFSNKRVSKADPKSLNIFLFIVCIFLIFIPYSKPILFPVSKSIELKNYWKDDVCLQSSGSTCGPSSLATIFAFYGISKTEREIAMASYSSSRGTENWYMIRYARKNGLDVKCMNNIALSDVQVPSIIGINLGSIGHFVTVLGKEDGSYIVGDPLLGRIILTEDEFKKRYVFKGFAINFKKGG
ncbi:MAG: cysteine peptidase family C39 domain-containing protein [Bacillota bacterium]